MSQFWNDRYAAKEYVYGETPNLFFKEQIEKLKPVKILLPAEGEGRNAVFAAKLGWEVSAFDQSSEGQNKAIKLANKNAVEINYTVGEFNNITYTQNHFDLIALIYAHFPGNLKSEYNQKLTTYLKHDGLVIFEAFGKNHLTYREKNPKIGGPDNVEMLYSIEEIKTDFSNFEILLLEEKIIELAEGDHHVGIGSVIRFVGKKI